MGPEPAEQEQSAEMSLTVIRADGTIEELGVVASEADGTLHVERGEN
jgi:hypothetical protein